MLNPVMATWAVSYIDYVRPRRGVDQSWVVHAPQNDALIDHYIFSICSWIDQNSIPKSAPSIAPVIESPSITSITVLGICS